MQTFYVRYDPNTLEVTSAGKMEERHIDRLIASDENIMKVSYALDPNTRYKINLQNNTLETFSIPTTVDDYLSELRNVIITQLKETDYTQSFDADDHLTSDEQKMWRQYRKDIRNAQNMTNLEAAVDLLPETDPKGEEHFAKYKEIISFKKLFDKQTANTI